MAHFAQLDENNVVTQVVVVSNADTSDRNGVEHEYIGVGFCKSLFGDSSTWVKTSYNGTIRKNYAGIGYTYDAGRDAFIPPQPYASWVLDEATCRWKAPVPMPQDGKAYRWDEPTLAWVEITN